MLDSVFVGYLLANMAVRKAIGYVRLNAASHDWVIEYGAEVEVDGRIQYFCDCSATNVHIIANGRTIATIHSHPDSAFLPSAEDIKEAMRTGIPGIVISQYGVEVALPDGTVERGQL